MSADVWRTPTIPAGVIPGDVMAVELVDGRRYTGTVTDVAADGSITVATVPVPAFKGGFDGEQGSTVDHEVRQ